MAGRYGRTRDTSGDYWPGFVDALATLVLVITLLMTLFVLAKYVQDQFASRLDTANQRLQEQIAQLSNLLSLEQQEKDSLSAEIAELRATLAARTNEAEALSAQLAGLEEPEADPVFGPSLATPLAEPDPEPDAVADLESRMTTLRTQLDEERQAKSAAEAQLALLNRQMSALRTQIASLQAALDAAEERDRENKATIADLGKRLNTALAQKVQELAKYRSEFFGRLRDVMADRDNIRVEGDRFVFQSEVLFGSGTAEINAEGKRQLRKLAAALRQLESDIPEELAWVLRIDGHTDDRPIRTTQYPSNWHLSAARAISVVEFLRNQGIDGEHLIAAGLGSFHPLDRGTSEDAYRRNRRIELKLTQR
ncbi:MAG: peptidoglycan -binding protein [Alphaproteobacteria bacterium]